ncbi:hypothetical protein [Haladaptatus cibarius]|uniref:hypothetical protein n=1 Tax=Haladaptatus cibarius TaxID=453847 RepID=UPI0006785068|nr:hypothetical protein [Haladaptatus cibarius]
MVATERAVSALKYGTVLAFVFGGIFGPPDPFTQVVFTPILLVICVPLVYFVLERQPQRNQHVAFGFGLGLVIFGGLQVANLLTSGIIDFRVRLAWVTTMLPIIAWVVYFRESGRALEESGA